MNVPNRLVLISLLLCSFFVQKIKAQARYKLSNSVDLIMGGDFGFRVINYDDANPEAVQQYNNRNQFENYKLNYRVGLNYIHGLNANFSLKTGIRFSNPGFTVTNVENFDPANDINTIEKEIKTGQIKNTFQYNYQLIEIPLGLRYTLTNGVCEPYFELGLAGNIYWQTVVKTDRAVAEIPRSLTLEENINTFNYVGFLSVGGNFYLSEKLSGFTQLVGRYQFNNLRESELEERIVGLGIEIGVRRYLR